MSRLFDIVASVFGLLLLAPIICIEMILVFLEDFGPPFYTAERMARGGGTFKMIKIRSMVRDSARAGVNSTSASDPRITRTGRLIRALKLDEIPQLWNVFIGDMSLVGPRPQVPTDASLYTEMERGMLTVRPGITDIASIVFSDYEELLRGSNDPDLLYNQIIRPWKSRLALLYIDKKSLMLDLWLIFLTILSLISHRCALGAVQSLLINWKADPLLIRMVAREEPLLPYAPPGASEVVASYPRQA